MSDEKGSAQTPSKGLLTALGFGLLLIGVVGIGFAGWRMANGQDIGAIAAISASVCALSSIMFSMAAAKKKPTDKTDQS